MATLSLAAAAATHAEKVVQSFHKDTFASIDTDSDGVLTRMEYLASAGQRADLREDFKFSAYFSQADIDDDNVLSMAEYQFARYLSEQAAYEVTLKSVADRLPPLLQEGLELLFKKVKRGSDGKVQFASLEEGLLELFGQREFDEQSAGMLKGLFEFADVIQDGVLNFNELDLFYFAVRESVVDSILARTMEAPDEDISRQHQHELQRVLREMLTARGEEGADFRLDEKEMVRRLQQHIPADAVEIAIYAKHLRGFFAGADQDRDGSLDPEELEHFARLVIRPFF